MNGRTLSQKLRKRGKSHYSQGQLTTTVELLIDPRYRGWTLCMFYTGQTVSGGPDSLFSYFAVSQIAVSRLAVSHFAVIICSLASQCHIAVLLTVTHVHRHSGAVI